ncbi:hypothetical protein FKW77_004316 [Venturia effusa]|uniref:Uncharacterized protein n=1 Tax=Venturia effusa TaxID=50376 RepID=A0A517LK42_9PEZI|nr:hypothetical protein FKW77_004316 [Venturia effusa]
MKFSTLMPFTALLPTVTYAWNIGTKCCHTVTEIDIAKGANGCVAALGYQWAVTENDEQACIDQCQVHTTYRRELRTYKTRDYDNGHQHCLCTNFDATSGDPKC